MYSILFIGMFTREGFLYHVLTKIDINGYFVIIIFIDIINIIIIIIIIILWQWDNN